jgi:hypothetical protein
MVTPRARALLIDLALGIGGVTFGTIAGGTPRSLRTLAIAGAALFVFSTVLYVAEHTAVLALINRTRPMSLVLACVLFTAVGVALVIGQAVGGTPAATMLVGMGAGLIGYRIRFGLTKTLPAKRLEQARLWGMPPERTPEEESDQFR